MNAHLEGAIDDVPPVAVSGGPVQSVECTSQDLTPVTLDGSASFDSDPGDEISHYQWFTDLGDAVGNQAEEVVELPLGEASYVLHAYDSELGSDADDVTVRVVDTTPPDLQVEPASLCLWPPNHARLKFTLGKELHAEAVDVCDPDPTVRIVGVISNEPDNGLGDGDTRSDVAFSDSAFCVRRERSGAGPGRRYWVIVKA